MRLAHLTSAIVATLLLAAPSVQAQAIGDLIPKQLAGPADEFSTMRPVDPADSAIHSKSALIPVTMRADKSGRAQWQGVLPVENGRARVLLFAPQGTKWDLAIRSPSGDTQRAAELLAKDSRAAAFGAELAAVPGDYFAFDNIENGDWELQLESSSNRVDSGFLLVEGDSTTRLVSYAAHRRQLVGESIGLIAQLSAEDGEKVVLANDAGEVIDASLRVTAPNGGVNHHPMFDDGQHADGAAGDGIFGGSFQASSEGSWQAQVSVRGIGRDGQTLLRSAEHLIPVVVPSLQLTATPYAAAVGNSRLAIAIPVSDSKSGGHYRAYAEVWGRDSHGRQAPVAWVGGMVAVEAGKLSLGFDERWISRSAAVSGFELRNLRIEDPDHFVTLASASRLALELPVPAAKSSSAIEIDEIMAMGPRPASLGVAKGTGSRLLLVHGYCSGGVWPAAQFSNASTFLDANQSRSHDQFARLIQTFGNTWNSFGVVAHSQGGPASLHLYTYYWSGLDKATGSRLIQSVGSPYQGTNLAGILATLGSWFGVGCGLNDNLTYSGASAWLAGIPTSRRAKVNYYTTAFRTTNWWTNDYCNFATDLVLSDPEDGTTEQAYGQLSGALNRGHTAGQCHTSGMRDPAQYLDATRNAAMNSNAAR